MKQAEDCWGTPGTPMLNQTGELKRRTLVEQQPGEFGTEGCGFGGVAK